MSAFHLRRDHVKLVASSYLRTSMRSGAGVIFLVLSMIVGLFLAGISVFPIEELQSRQHDATAAFHKAVEEWGPSVLSAFADVRHEAADFMLRDHPALMTVFLIMLLAFLPFLASLAGFNQTSGDIGSRGLRYVLLRTERSNIFLGRLIATYVFTLSVITLIIATVALYTIVKVGFYPASDVLLWLGRGWLASALFLLPWVALAAWISSTMDIAFLSLVILEVGLLVWIILVAVMRKNVEEAKYAAYLTPWGWRMWLLDPSIGRVLAGVVAMLGFSGIYTWLGLRHFDKRDL